MDTHERRLLTIITEAALERALVADARRFGAHGYTVLEAASGEEALELYEQHANEVSLVLSDVVLPGMQGVEILDALRERGAVASRRAPASCVRTRPGSPSRARWPARPVDATSSRDSARARTWATPTGTRCSTTGAGRRMPR